LQCNFAYVMLVFGQNFQVMCFSMFFCLIILSPSQNSSRFSSIFMTVHMDEDESRYIYRTHTLIIV
jgi:hypothetical protein